MSFTLGQRLFAHGGIYVLSRLANRSISIVLLPLYAHLLGAEGLGVVRVLAPIGIFATLLFSQGVPSAWFRLRFDHLGTPRLRVFETTVLWYLLASTSLGLLVVSLFGDFLAERFTPGIPYYPLAFLTVLGAMLNVFANLYERKLQAEQRPVAFSIFSGVRTLLSLVLVVAFVGWFRWGVMGKIGAEGVAALILFTVSLILMRPGAPWTCSKVHLREALAFGLPLLPHSLAVTTNEMIGILMVNAWLGLETAAVYAVALQIGAVTGILTVALNQAHSPIFVKAMRDSDEAEAQGRTAEAVEIRRQVARSNLLSPALVGCFGLVVAAVAKEVIALLTPEEFHTAWRYVAPVTGSVVLIAVGNSFNQSVFYNPKRVRWAAVASVSAAVMNLFACVLLIGPLGPMGAALAGVLSSLMQAALLIRIGQGAVPLSHPWLRWGGVTLLIALGLGGVWFIDSLGLELIPGLLAKGGVGGVFSLLVVLSAGVRTRSLTRFAGALAARSRKAGK